MVLARGYFQLLSAVSSRQWIEEEEGNWRFVNVHLPDEFPWATRFWEHDKTLMITTHARQIRDSSIKELLTTIAKGTHTVNTPLLLKSTST